MKFQFTIRHAILVVSLVCVYLVLRTRLSLFWIYFLPPVYALVVTSYRHFAEARLSLKSGALTGGVAAGVAALVAGTDVAEQFRRSTEGEYFAWSRDWPELLFAVATEMAWGAIVGAVVILASRIFLGRRGE